MEQGNTYQKAFDTSYYLYYEKACLLYAQLFLFNQTYKLCKEYTDFSTLQILAKVWCLSQVEASLFDLVEHKLISQSQMMQLRTLKFELVSK